MSGRWASLKKSSWTMATAASLTLAAAASAGAQTLVTHRIPAALAMEAVTAAIATCTA